MESVLQCGIACVLQCAKSTWRLDSRSLTASCRRASKSATAPRNTARSITSYGMSQCVAVCCSVLQCVAVCCSVLQCVAVCCNVLQCVAVCCKQVGDGAAQGCARQPTPIAATHENHSRHKTSNFDSEKINHVQPMGTCVCHPLTHLRTHLDLVK